ncbi:MAG: hypothetical protein Q8P80_02340, partial [Candidatus Levybacteria bacterium]|nr:hypothetical protein [Candidatus Levybacteria bacterium]
MFALAILIGIYSYLIFGLGLWSLLTKENISILTFLFFFLLIVLNKKYFRSSFKCFKTFKQWRKITDKFTLIILIILGAQMIVNLIGALGPEISFDALWYHLTLPKMYLLSGSISHIPGGLLYYSDMPKLGEMLYALPLSFGSQTGAKLIHFSFGLLSLAALYFLSRK